MSCSENTSGSCLGWSFAVPVAVFQLRPLLVSRLGQAVPRLHMFLPHCIILFCGNLDGVLRSGMALDLCVQSWAVFAVSTGRMSSLKEEMIVDVDIPADCVYSLTKHQVL